MIFYLQKKFGVMVCIQCIPQKAHVLKLGPQLVAAITERSLEHEGYDLINGLIY
jgi:hypothetical protein